MSSMTISQALRQVKKIKGELSENVERAKNSITFKEGEDPAFEFQRCMEKITALRTSLVALQSHIAETNAITLIQFNGASLSLAYAVLRLKEYKGEIAFLSELKGLARNKDVSSQMEVSFDFETDKRVNKTVVHYCKLPEAKRAELAEKVQASFDALNDTVETANHRTVLKE